MKHIFKFAALLCMGGVLLLTSCENKDDSLPAMGSTMEFATTPVAVDNTIDFLWYKVRGASSYDLQVSTSSSFDDLVVNESALGTDHYRAEGMQYDTPYFYRIRANYADGSTGAWVTGAEPVICQSADFQMMLFPAINKLDGSTATIKFSNNKRAEYVDIFDSMTNTLVTRVEIDDAARAAGQIVVAGLRRDHASDLNPNRIVDSTIRYRADMYVTNAQGEEPYLINSRGFTTFTPRPVGSVSGLYLKWGSFRWDKIFPATRVAVYTADTVTMIVEKTLSPAEIAAGEAVIDTYDLPQNAAYVGVVYNDNTPYDYLTAYMPKAFFISQDSPRTTAAQVIKDLNETWPGRVIQIATGAEISLGQLVLDKDYLTLKGESATDRSVITVPANGTIRMSGTFNGDLVFENIRFKSSEATFSPLVLTLPKQVDAVDAPPVRIGTLRFENCIFENIQSVLKISADANIAVDSLVLNNCIYWFNKSSNDTGSGIVGRLGGSAGSPADGKGTKVKNIVVTNSTIVGLVGHIIKRETVDGGNMKFTMTNSTMFDFSHINDELIRANGGKNYVFFANNVFAGAVYASSQDTDFDPVLVYRGGTANIRPLITADGNSANIFPAFDVRATWNNYCAGDYMLNGTKAYTESGYKTGGNYGFTRENAMIKFSDDMNSVVSERLFNAPIVTDVLTLDMGFQNPDYAAIGVGDPRWLNGNAPAPLPEDPNKNPWP